MIKILLVEARAIIQLGLKQIVQSTPDMTIVAEATCTAQARKLAPSCDWDTAVLDLTLPTGAELELVKEWRQEYPYRPILIFTLHPDEQFALRALKAGAAGYLTIEAPPEEFLTAIRKIANGGKYIPIWLAEKMVGILSGGVAPHEALSDREYEVFCLLATGKTVSEVARQLMLSVKTISTYRSRVLDKVHLTNNAQLMQYAISRGLIRVTDEKANESLRNDPY